uniref:Aquaporin 8a, tandem duplicate 1 n=1 Tax=Mastacembelus armatus TaxID=205130 RepID=A0A3Q3L2B4_9TELE
MTLTKTEVFTVTEIEEPAPDEDARSTQTKRLVYEHYVQPCLAELFGTTLFVFVGCASVIGNVTNTGLIQPAVAHGLALGVLITIFGQISGGHFNPVVSLSVYLCGGMELVLLVPYVLAQMLGGMIGAGLSKAMYPLDWYAAMMTLILTMVVCMGAVNSQTRSPWAPFCIGLTVTANIFAGGMVSGACMNPARAFGPAMAANQWNYHWVYWVGPTCGALLTVILIRLLFGDQKTRIVLKTKFNVLKMNEERTS